MDIAPQGSAKTKAGKSKNGGKNNIHYASHPEETIAIKLNL